MEQSATQFEATVRWDAAEPLLPGRTYVLETSGGGVRATIAPLKYVLDVATGARTPAAQLERGQTGVCEVELERPIRFDDETEPVFRLADRVTGAVVGSGHLHFALRRSSNVRWREMDVDKPARTALMGHRPCVVWLTGLSGAGKSTIADLLEQRLHAAGCHTYLLDGDNVRHGLNKDLGFTPADRVENIRRVGEVAKLMVDAGLIVIASFISPYRAERHTVRSLLEPGEFFEVFVDVPLDVAEQRDPKGLYAKARRGDLVNFTGIDAPYEEPERPEVHVDTATLTPDDACRQILAALSGAGVLQQAVAG